MHLLGISLKMLAVSEWNLVLTIWTPKPAPAPFGGKKSNLDIFLWDVLKYHDSEDDDGRVVFCDVDGSSHSTRFTDPASVHLALPAFPTRWNLYFAHPHWPLLENSDETRFILPVSYSEWPLSCRQQIMNAAVQLRQLLFRFDLPSALCRRFSFVLHLLRVRRGVACRLMRNASAVGLSRNSVSLISAEIWIYMCLNGSAKWGVWIECLRKIASRMQILMRFFFCSPG